MSWLFSGGTSVEDQRKAAIAAPIRELRSEQTQLLGDIRSLERTVDECERTVKAYQRRLAAAVARGDNVSARRASTKIAEANKRIIAAERQITRLRRMEGGIGSLVNEANMSVVSRSVNGSVDKLNMAVGGVIGARRDVMAASRSAVVTKSVFEQFGEMESTVNETLGEIQEDAIERIDEENNEALDQDVVLGDMSGHAPLSGETLDALEIDPSLGSFSTDPRVIMAAAQAKNRQGAGEMARSLPRVPGGQRDRDIEQDLIRRLDAIKINRGYQTTLQTGGTGQRGDWSIGAPDDDDDVTFL